jgi:magnesium transporter
MITIFRYNGEAGFNESHDIATITTVPQKGESLWIDFEAPTAEEAQVLSRVFGFHHLAIEDCWHEPQHPKVDDYGNYLFLVVHGVRDDTEHDEFATHELNIFLGPNFLVSFHTLHSRTIEAMQVNIRRNPNIMARGMDFILHQIMDRVIDNYFPRLDVIEDRIDALENDLVADARPELLTRIFDLRHTVAHLRRVAIQEREVLIQISRGEFPFVSEKAQVYFKDIYDHLFRIVEVADNLRETLNVMVQVYVSMVSNQLNHTMRVLTVIATLMLPLTVITGVYGMNFDVMPELRWKYGYFVVLGFMAVVAGGMLLYFRRRRWL